MKDVSNLVKISIYTYADRVLHTTSAKQIYKDVILALLLGFLNKVNTDTFVRKRGIETKDTIISLLKNDMKQKPLPEFPGWQVYKYGMTHLTPQV